jgi:hypothetical protein
MASDDPRFNCPTCGKSYRWKPEMAGRSAKCGCGGKLVVPAERPAPPSNGAATAPKVAPATPAPAPARPPVSAVPQAKPSLLSPRPVKAAAPAGPACPWCNKPLPEGAVLCVNCGYNLKTKQRIAVVVEKVDVEDDDGAADQPTAAGPDDGSPAKGEPKSGG